MFLSGLDIQKRCNNIDLSYANDVASDVVSLFCSILPIELAPRSISYMPFQIYYFNWWNKIDTALINISWAKIDGKNISIKTDWILKSSLWFKEHPSFDPIFTIEIISWYQDKELPKDIKDAMLEMACDTVLNQWIASNITSYQLGPRKVTFSDKTKFDQIQSVLSKYTIV